MYILFTICVALFLGALLLVLTKKIDALDVRISHFFITHRTPRLTEIMMFFTNIGKGKPGLAIFALFFLGFWSVALPLARNIGLSLLFSVVAGSLLKRIVRRERPQNDPLVTENDYSFPSAHAFSSAALYGAVALNAAAFGTIFGTVIAALAVLFFLMIGLSRVYLGVHYPSDVVGGWALGLFFVVLVLLVF